MSTFVFYALAGSAVIQDHGLQLASGHTQHRSGSTRCWGLYYYIHNSYICMWCDECVLVIEYEWWCDNHSSVVAQQWRTWWILLFLFRVIILLLIFLIMPDCWFSAGTITVNNDQIPNIFTEFLIIHIFTLHLFLLN